MDILPKTVEFDFFWFLRFQKKTIAVKVQLIILEQFKQAKPWENWEVASA